MGARAGALTKPPFDFAIIGRTWHDAARIVAEEAEKDGYPLVVYHIPTDLEGRTPVNMSQ